MNRTSVHGTACRAAAVALLVSLWGTSSGCASQAAQQPAEAKPEAKGPSLYERVGGVNAIAVLMEDVIDRSYADPIFNANPRIVDAHHRYSKAAYKYNATALACMVMGGPCKYTGRSVKEAHQHLQITETEWRQLIAIFRDSMTRFEVPSKEQGEIVAILEGAKGDVVVPSARSASR